MLAQYFPPGQTSNHGRYLLPWLEMVPRGVGGFWDIGICFDDLWLRLLLWNGSAQLPTLLSYCKFGQSASQPDTIFGNPGLMLKDWGLVQILPHWTHWAVEYIDTLSKSEDGAPFFLYCPLTGLHTPIPNCTFPWVHQQQAGGCVWQLCLSDRLASWPGDGSSRAKQPNRKYVADFYQW